MMVAGSVMAIEFRKWLHMLGASVPDDENTAS